MPADPGKPLDNKQNMRKLIPWFVRYDPWSSLNIHSQNQNIHYEKDFKPFNGHFIALQLQRC